MGKFHEQELPGEDLVWKGLNDLANGIESIESVLVCIGAPRLKYFGIKVPPRHYEQSPERRLYELLAAEDPLTAHGRMNALIRRLVSFEDAGDLLLFKKDAA